MESIIEFKLSASLLSLLVLDSAHSLRHMPKAEFLIGGLKQTDILILDMQRWSNPTGRSNRPAGPPMACEFTERHWSVKHGTGNESIKSWQLFHSFNLISVRASLLLLFSDRRLWFSPSLCLKLQLNFLKATLTSVTPNSRSLNFGEQESEIFSLNPQNDEESEKRSFTSWIRALWGLCGERKHRHH